MQPATSVALLLLARRQTKNKNETEIAFWANILYSGEIFFWVIYGYYRWMYGQIDRWLAGTDTDDDIKKNESKTFFLLIGFALFAYYIQ